ncbi:hypothetical protein NIES4106_52550 [Fischerella sp. NIES-4106]|nr:hypothetical protein NIES4106_52550 [Fischerella sp. NIES-4106]
MNPPQSPRERPTVYTQVEIFHVETVSRLELKFQAHSESPLKWTGTNFFLSPLKRTCAMKLGIYSEAVLCALAYIVNASVAKISSAYRDSRDCIFAKLFRDGYFFCRYLRIP